LTLCGAGDKIKKNTFWSNWMYNSNRPSFRERVARFMMGRNGTDALYHVTVTLSFVLIFINIFAQSFVISVIELLLICYAIFRVLSRNVYKRQRENQVWLRFIGKIRGAFSLMKSKRRDRKTHVYRRCPSCKSTLRLPRRSGTHTARCPRCSHRFDVKIR
jgi:predicted SprT family Zn-dependent metalloprotease